MHGVQLSSLTHRFARQPLLEDLSLEIPSGSYLVVLGASGSGKSTLLKMIAGLQIPDAGTIHIGGQNMVGVPPHCRDVSLLFQQDALYPHQTVRQNVLFGASKRAEKTDAWSRTLRQTRIFDLLDRKPDTLSGGEKKRVGIAKTMIRNAGVQLLDEPLSAIDSTHRSSLTVDLRHMHRSSDATVIHVTHDAEEAFRLADEIAVLDAGKIRQVDAPQQLLTSPRHIAVTRLLAVFGCNEFIIHRGDQGSKELLIGAPDSETSSTRRLVIPSSAIRLSPPEGTAESYDERVTRLRRMHQTWQTRGNVTCVRRLPYGNEIDLVTDGSTWQVRLWGQCDLAEGPVQVHVNTREIHWFDQHGNAMAADE